MARKDAQGNWLNARNKPVPPENIDRLAKELDRIIETSHKEINVLVKQLRAKKKRIRDRLIKYMQKEYKSKGEEFTDLDFENGLTLRNFDGRKAVKFNVVKPKGLNEKKGIISKKLNKIMDDLGREEINPNLKLIFEAWKIDGENLSVGKLLEIVKYPVKHPDWAEFQMLALDAIEEQSKKSYMNFTIRKPGAENENKEETINLNFSSI